MSYNIWWSEIIRLRKEEFVAIVTIFSGSYCHGEEIARRVSKRLGNESVDEKVLEITAEKYGITKDKLLKSIKGQVTLFNAFTHDREKNIARLKLSLAEAATNDNLLLYGFIGHLLPRTISHVLKTCIIANFDYRIKEAARIEAISENDAEKIIHKDDSERLEWTSYLFEKPPYDESLYDLIIPVHSVVLDDVVNSICKFAASEQIRSTLRSQKVAEDFLLSAKVELALMEKGHKAEVFSESGNIVITLEKDVLRLKQYQEELGEIAVSVEGVDKIDFKFNSKFQTSSLNPWANIDVPPKILLVDDEKDFVETLSERLRTRNLESSVVYDGEQALEFVKKDAPDVMVLDLMMPGINGIEVLRKVKNEHPNVEVIILTGHGSKHEEETAEDYGAFAYLRKPVNIDLLARVMNEAYKKINRSRTIVDNNRGADNPD